MKILKLLKTQLNNKDYLLLYLKRVFNFKSNSDVITFIHDTINKVLSSSSNYILEVAMWPNFCWFSTFMREFFYQENRFFLRGGLGLILEFYSCVEKCLKSKSQKCWEKLAGNLFALPSCPILNRVESELKGSSPVKTVKKEKYRLHYFLACSV